MGLPWSISQSRLVLRYRKRLIPWGTVRPREAQFAVRINGGGLRTGPTKRGANGIPSPDSKHADQTRWVPPSQICLRFWTYAQPASAALWLPYLPALVANEAGRMVKEAARRASLANTTAGRKNTLTTP